jgi:hypothetical protein
MGRVVHEYDPEDPVEDFTPLPFDDTEGNPGDPEAPTDEPEGVPA